MCFPLDQAVAPSNLLPLLNLQAVGVLHNARGPFHGRDVAALDGRRQRRKTLERASNRGLTGARLLDPLRRLPLRAFPLHEAVIEHLVFAPREERA